MCARDTFLTLVLTVELLSETWSSLIKTINENQLIGDAGSSENYKIIISVYYQ